jgi:hypothetical protein
MKKIIYGFGLMVSISGAYAMSYCPDTLISDQMDILAVKQIPYGYRKGGYGGVTFNGQRMLFTAASEADRRVIEEALLVTKTAQKESETVQTNPKIVTCSYQCRGGYWKFKLLAPIY